MTLLDKKRKEKKRKEKKKKEKGMIVGKISESRSKSQIFSSEFDFLDKKMKTERSQILRQNFENLFLEVPVGQSG